MPESNLCENFDFCGKFIFSVDVFDQQNQVTKSQVVRYIFGFWGNSDVWGKLLPAMHSSDVSLISLH